ncbi:MAG TPA: hypothetical protein DCG79_04760 [Clostridiales bacterium]|nr:hypothetical protein [Clostridiales bacterium]
MKKALRKLIPALVMLLIAAAFVGTSTYAWFSMNRIVNVSGMSVTTKVEDSLLIAETNAEANYFAGPLAQSRVGRLRPVSSVNGVSFFYSEAGNVTGNGAARSVTYTAYSEAATANNTLAPANTGKTNYDEDFQTAYGVNGTIDGDNVIYGYMDYTFYIKATNVTNTNEALKLTTLNLLYNGAAVTTEKAWRVAVFAQEASANTAVDAALDPSTDLKAILALTGSANYTQTEDATPLPKAASATNATAGVTYASAGWAVATVGTGANATKYYKITVRLWLEGEDNTCNNETFASLTNAYSLSIQFRLGGDEDPVTAIGSVVPNP